MCQAVGASEAKAVRVRIVTVRETNSTVAATAWTLLATMRQCYTGDCASQSGTHYATGNTTKYCAAANFLIPNAFSQVFKPVCHFHLLSSISLWQVYYATVLCYVTGAGHQANINGTTIN